MKALLFLAAIAAFGQTRGIVPESVIQARPQAKATASTAKAKSAPPTYKAVDADVTSSLRPPASARQVGVTIWRLRPALATDSGARILVQEDNQSVEWVPERVGSTSSLRQGDRVRLSIESPDDGYLYVIDRERYTSGERGRPYLIFPTTRTRGGDNKVAGGRLIDIPAQDDRPSFFSLRQSRGDQTEEELTVLLTKTPLEGVEIGPKAQALTTEQVDKWEKQWGTLKTELFELSGGTGKTWTQAEQQAGANATRLLTQEDPAPQTVYRVSSKAGDPVMIKVHLKYTGAGRGKQ